MFGLMRNVVFATHRSVGREVTSRGFGKSPILNEIFKVDNLDDFDEKVKKSTAPMFVNFFASWSQNSQMQAMRMENIVTNKQAGLDLAQVDVASMEEVLQEYNIDAVPVLLVLKDGKEVKRLVGLQNHFQLDNWVEKVVDGCDEDDDD